MQERADLIIDALRNVRGLHNFTILSDEDKKTILEMEDGRNTGVLACLGRRFVLAATHDSVFRQPIGSLVVQTSEGIVFPAQPFPEVGAKSISASPSKKVHDYIVSKFNMKITDEHATLLIGFD